MVAGNMNFKMIRNMMLFAVIALFAAACTDDTDGEGVCGVRRGGKQ